jgi:hypothetical protein
MLPNRARFQRVRALDLGQCPSDLGVLASRVAPVWRERARAFARSFTLPEAESTTLAPRHPGGAGVKGWPGRRIGFCSSPAREGRVGAARPKGDGGRESGQLEAKLALEALTDDPGTRT